MHTPFLCTPFTNDRIDQLFRWSKTEKILDVVWRGWDLIHWMLLQCFTCFCSSLCFLVFISRLNRSYKNVCCFSDMQVGRFKEDSASWDNKESEWLHSQHGWLFRHFVRYLLMHSVDEENFMMWRAVLNLKKFDPPFRKQHYPVHQLRTTNFRLTFWLFVLKDGINM